MRDGSGPIHGRGASDNPANRFELISYERDPDSTDPDDPAPQTQFFKDTSRTIIASNDSPDVGFERSINPYRGCEHGCVYCLSGDTRILLGDGTYRCLEDIRVGDEVYGTQRRGWYRRYVRTKVLAHWRLTRPAFRVKLLDGTCLVAGSDHRFLTERGWKFVAGKNWGSAQRPYLTTNNKLMGTGAFAALPQKDENYKTGYLCGIIRGDGLLASYVYPLRRSRGGKKQWQFRLALIDQEALLRATDYLREFEIRTHRFMFQEASAHSKPMEAIRINARGSVERIKELVAWPSPFTDSWCRGFLAGIFDAEGAYSDRTLRISNTDPTIIAHITRCLKHLGFDYIVEHVEKCRKRSIDVVRIRGGLREHLRFFHSVDTAIGRKRDIEGQALKSSANIRVASIEALDHPMHLFDITTGTGDFIANGVVSHNCYARPTHEFLGFSAGLDFETRIMVKEDAPELLRRELNSPRWEPKVVAISGVTDAYQPAERRFRLTRRCLKVFAEFRNPVGVVTKNHLVTRDIDLLSELARHDAGAVYLSITTLDADLASALEPRATRPEGRLKAIEELTAAGIPVGVLVAPVIPGLTDHEMPSILEAAVQVGAQFAGHVMLRLPYAVAPLFERWLEQHAPLAKEKVLGRIRDMRGGKLNEGRFGSRMTGEGVLAEQIHQLFALACRRLGIEGNRSRLSTAAFRRPGGTQQTLFD